MKEKIEEQDNKEKRFQVNNFHIEIYDKMLEILNYVLEEYSKELTRADIEYIEMPKNTIAVFDFLISSMTKIQKGQRLALGLDDLQFEDSPPQINIIEGLNEEKI